MLLSPEDAERLVMLRQRLNELVSIDWPCSSDLEEAIRINEEMEQLEAPYSSEMPAEHFKSLSDGFSDGQTRSSFSKMSRVQDCYEDLGFGSPDALYRVIRNNEDFPKFMMGRSIYILPERAREWFEQKSLRSSEASENRILLMLGSKLVELGEQLMNEVRHRSEINR